MSKSMNESTPPKSASSAPKPVSERTEVNNTHLDHITRVMRAAAKGNLSQRSSLTLIDKDSPVYAVAMAGNLVLDRVETLNREVLGKSLVATRRIIQPIGGVDVTPVVWVGLLSLVREILVGQQGLVSQVLFRAQSVGIG